MTHMYEFEFEKDALRVRVVLVSELVAMIIEHNGKRAYLPPLVTKQKIALPKKYKGLIDTSVFPEIIYVNVRTKEVVKWPSG